MFKTQVKTKTPFCKDWCAFNLELSPLTSTFWLHLIKERQLLCRMVENVDLC